MTGILPSSSGRENIRVQPRLEIDAERHAHRPGVQRISVLADVQHDHLPAPLLRPHVDGLRENRNRARRLRLGQDLMREVLDHQPQPGKRLAERRIDRLTVRRLRRGVRAFQGTAAPDQSVPDSGTPDWPGESSTRNGGRAR